MRSVTLMTTMALTLFLSAGCGGGGSGDAGSGDAETIQPSLTTDTTLNGNYSGVAYSEVSVGEKSGRAVQCTLVSQIAIKVLDGHLFSLSDDLGFIGKISDEMRLYDTKVTYEGRAFGVFDGSVHPDGADAYFSGNWEDDFGCRGTYHVDITAQDPQFEPIEDLRIFDGDFNETMIVAWNDYGDHFDYNISDDSDGVLDVTIDDKGRLGVFSNMFDGETYTVWVSANTKKTGASVSLRIQNKPRLIRDDMNETVFDPTTGLTWQDDDDAKEKGVVSSLTYTENNEEIYCQGLELNGMSDWRPPTYDELFGLYDVTSPHHLDVAFMNYAADEPYPEYITSSTIGYVSGLSITSYKKTLRSYDWGYGYAANSSHIRCVHD